MKRTYEVTFTLTIERTDRERDLEKIRDDVVEQVENIIDEVLRQDCISVNRVTKFVDAVDFRASELH